VITLPVQSGNQPDRSIAAGGYVLAPVAITKNVGLRGIVVERGFDRERPLDEASRFLQLSNHANRPDKAKRRTGREICRHVRGH